MNNYLKTEVHNLITSLSSMDLSLPGPNDTDDDVFFDLLHHCPFPHCSDNADNSPESSASASIVCGPDPHSTTSATTIRRHSIRRGSLIRESTDADSESDLINGASTSSRSIQNIENLKENENFEEKCDSYEGKVRSFPFPSVVTDESTLTTAANDDGPGNSADSAAELGDSPSNWLEYAVGLLIRAILFQIKIFFVLIRCPVLSMLHACMFFMDPFGTLRKGKGFLLGMFGRVLCCVGPSAQRWFREHKSLLDVAFRCGWGFLWSIYVCCILFALLVSSLVVSVFLVKFLVEKPFQMRQVLNFDYTKQSPVAYVHIISCAGVGIGQASENDIIVSKWMGGRVIPAKQKVQVTVSLLVPESDYNKNLGVFQIRVDFLSSNGKTISSSSQPCILKFRSEPIRLITTFLKIAPLVTGYISESQTLNVKIRGFVEGDVPISCLKVTLEQRAEYLPGAGIPQIYESSIFIESELLLFKRIIWHWKIIIFIWITMMAFMMELLFVLVCCWPIIIPRTRQRSGSDRSSGTQNNLQAPKDYLELHDDAYPNGAEPSFSTWKETTGSTAVAEKTTSATEIDVQEIPPASSVVMPSKSFTTDGSPPVRSADGSTLGQKVDVPTSISSSIPDPTFKATTGAVTVAAHTIVGSDKSNSQNGSVVNPPLFNFGNEVVQSTEVTAADAPAKESTKSGPIFGLDKVASSKKPGADAPLVNFGINKNVDNVPKVSFTFSSSIGGESGGLKFGASSDSKLTSSISSTTVPVAVDSMPKVLESDNGDAKTNIVTGSSAPSSEPAVSSAASTSLLTSPANIFTFSNSLNQNNGPVASSATLASPFPSIGTNNFRSQSIFSSSSLAASSSSSIISATATSSSTSMTTSTPALIASSNSSSSTRVVASSSPTTSSFKFGYTPISSTSLPASSPGTEPVETMSRQDGGIGNLGSTVFVSSSAAVGSTGSGILGFSSLAMTTIKSQSQGSVFGTTSGSVLGMLAPSATSGFTTSTQSQSVGFGSSASSPFFGLTGNIAFSTGSSLFTSSNTSANIFNSGTTSGQSTLASSSEANPVTVSSNSSSSSTWFALSSWQPSTGGGDKSGRKFVRVKRKQRKK